MKEENGLGLVLYRKSASEKEWKEIDHVVENKSSHKNKLRELIKRRSYQNLYDFDNHLINVELDWISNSELNMK